MAFDSVVAYLSAAVAQDGSFALNYPPGRAASDFAAAGHRMAVPALQMFLDATDEFTVDFGASVITITYLLRSTLPIYSRVALDLALRSSSEGSSSGGSEGALVDDVVTVGDGASLLKDIVAKKARFRTLVSDTSALSVDEDGDTLSMSVAAATSLMDGLLTAAEKTKLSGVAAGAQINPPTYSGAQAVGLVPGASNVSPSTNKFLAEDGQWRSPPAGAEGGIADAASDGAKYVRKDAGWVPETPGITNLVDLDDVSMPAPADGQVATWRDNALQLEDSGLATQELVDHPDVTGTPANGQVPTFRTSDSKFHFETPPSAGDAQTDRVTKTSKSGPLTEFLSSDYVGKITKIDPSAGEVTIKLNDSIAHASDEILLASFLIVAGDGTHGLTINADSPVTGGVRPIISNSGKFNKSTGVAGTALTTGSNTHTFNVKAGNNVALYAILYLEQANTAVAAVSSGISINGAAETLWGQSAAVVISGGPPSVYALEIPLGLVSVDTDYTLKPGIGTNTNAYQLFVFCASNAEQSGSIEHVSIGQTGTGLSSVTTTVSADASDRTIVYSVGKRANTANGAISISGDATTTLLQEGASQAGATPSQNGSNCRTALATEPGSSGSNSTTFAMPAVNPYAVCSFAIVPEIRVTMALNVVGNKSPSVTELNKLVNLLYDSNDKVAWLQY